MNKKLSFSVLLLVAIIINADASDIKKDFTYYNIGNYQSSFTKEFGKKTASKFIKKAFKNESFLKAYGILNKPLSSVNKPSEYNASIYPKMLDYLKKAGDTYANWIGLNLYVYISKSYPSDKYTKKYGLYFAKRLEEQNSCSSYLFEGIFYKKLKMSKKKQIEAWQNGIDSHCLGTKYEKFYLIANRNITKNSF